MTLRRPFSPTPTGPLVTPWMIYGSNSRIITLFGRIHSSINVDIIVADSIPFLAEEIFASLFYLAGESRDPIKMVINNRGDDIHAVLMIVQAIDPVQAMGIDVEILVVGSSMSMASIILASGTRGKRYALDRSIVHLHAESRVIGGQGEDFERAKEYTDRLARQMYLLLAQRTKIPEYHLEQEQIAPRDKTMLENDEGRIKLVKRFLKNETYLSAYEAQAAGIIDAVIPPGDGKIMEIFNAPTEALSEKQEGGRA